MQGLKSRAAFKLLELDSKYHLFRRGRGQVVVDLGYAPGSWSQVAVDRTAPNGTVVGIDIIPAQPPKGVSTIQGNFLSTGVQGMVKQFLVDGDRKRRAERAAARKSKKNEEELEGKEDEVEEEDGGVEVTDRPSYIDLERMAARESEAESGSSSSASSSPAPEQDREGPARDEDEKPNLRLVDVRKTTHPPFLPIQTDSGIMEPSRLTPPVAFTIITGSPQRHVSTLAPDPWFLDQQFE